MTVNVKGTLPKGDQNGLGELIGDLVREPYKSHVAICIIETSKITHNLEDGTIVPTVRVAAIEPIASDSAEAVRLRNMVRRAYEERTGRAELPFEYDSLLGGIGDEAGS